MANLNGTQTQKNLAAAFAGESQARNRYVYYAAQARKEGLEQIANLFESLSRNEQEHARLWAGALGLIGTSEQNMAAALMGEKEEADNMYVEFAHTARKEGFPEIADQFDAVAKIERNHEAKFKMFLESMKDDATESTVFAKASTNTWECRTCGTLQFGPRPPESCPLCSHAESFFRSYFKNK